MAATYKCSGKGMAKIISPNGGSDYEGLSEFAQYLGFKPEISRETQVTSKDLNKDLGVIIFAREYNQKFNPTALSLLTSDIWVKNIPIITIGDATSDIVMELGINTATIDEHFLPEDEVHVMFDSNDEVYYMPSRHKTTVMLSEYNIYDPAKDNINRHTANDAFTTIITTTDISAHFTPVNNIDGTYETPEIEIFAIKSLRLLGIYGNPNYFFSEAEAIDNKIALKTLRLIEKVFNKITSDLPF